MLMEWFESNGGKITIKIGVDNIPIMSLIIGETNCSFRIIETENLIDEFLNPALQAIKNRG